MRRSRMSLGRWCLAGARWRELRLLELASVRRSIGAEKRERLLRVASEFDQKLATWHLSGLLEDAAEVVFAVGTDSQRDRAAGAIQQILRSDRKPGLLSLARELIGFPPSFDPNEPEGKARLSDDVRRLRRRLSCYPRDTIAYCELARCYTNLGQRRSAERAMDVALKLQPHNRYVMRCASRMFVHFQDLGRALSLFRRYNNQDPLLLSVHLALSDLRGGAIDGIKVGRALINDGNHSARKLSEDFCAALATIELKGGGFKLRTAVLSEEYGGAGRDVVAQVRWLRWFLLFFDSFLLRVRRGFEARAERARQDERWGNSVENAEWWLWDEPFAVRPGHIGSFLASEIIGDQVRAEGFARQALVANKEDPTAINNLICVLAMQNKVEGRQRR